MLVQEKRPEESSGPTSPDAIDERDRRALTEYLTVLESIGRAKGAPSLYLVVSHSGREYLVDTVSGACECADAMYRRPAGGCKHIRRVAFETGIRPVPQEFVHRVPSDFARFVDADPTIVMADGGTTDSHQRKPTSHRSSMEMADVAV